MTSFIKSGKIIEYKGNVKNMQICIIRGVNAYILSLLNTYMHVHLYLYVVPVPSCRGQSSF